MPIEFPPQKLSFSSEHDFFKNTKEKKSKKVRLVYFLFGLFFLPILQSHFEPHPAIPKLLCEIPGKSLMM